MNCITLTQYQCKKKHTQFIASSDESRRGSLIPTFHPSQLLEKNGQSIFSSISLFPLHPPFFSQFQTLILRFSYPYSTPLIIVIHLQSSDDMAFLVVAMVCLHILLLYMIFIYYVYCLHSFIKN